MATLAYFVVGIIAYGAALSAGYSVLVAGLIFTAITVIGGILTDKKTGQKIRPDQLNSATATEARPVPVVFGVVRLSGNFLRYDKDSFHNKAIRKRASSWTSKKTVGYKYFLTFEYGICMGAIDKITKVWSNPGEDIVWEGDEDFSTGDIQDLDIEGDKKGGAATVYRGTTDQVRNVSERYADDVGNYRGVCFANFEDHYIGNSPHPSTYMFEVHRLPKCVDENGLPINGIFTNGSLDNTHPSYEEANPAAVVFEIYTNKEWGRGLPLAKIDTEAFKTASLYYAQQNTGISFSIGSQDALTETIELIQMHVSLIVYTQGDVVTCRAMSNPATSYAERIKINRSMIKDIQMSRRAWAGTPNEIRASFINRENNYQQEIVVAQDLGSIQMANTINSIPVQIDAFGNRNTAEAHAYRILSEIAYPSAQLTGVLTRFHADLQPGAFVELVMDDFNGQDVTTFWRVKELDDGDQDPQGVRVTLEEDFYATAFIGTSADFTIPTPSYEFRNTLGNNDVNTSDDFFSKTNAGEINDAMIVETPFSLSRGAEVVLFALDAEKSDLLQTDGFWRIDGTAGSFNQLWEQEMPVAYFGTLAANLDSGAGLLREQAIDITVDDEWQRQKIVDAVGQVKIAGDHFANLTQTLEAVMVIGDEFMQIGDAETTATGVRIKALARGVQATAQENHLAGAKVVIFRDLEDGTNLQYSTDLPKNTDLQMQFDRFSIRGFWGQSANNPVVSYRGRSQQPFPHELRSVNKAGSVWTLEIRPRIFITDLQTEFFQEVFDRKAATNPYGVRVAVMNGSTEVTSESLGREYFTGAAPATGVDDYEWEAHADDDAGTALVRLVVNGMSGYSLKIYTTDEDGNESEALHIT